jgi:hypothetical protein
MEKMVKEVDSSNIPLMNFEDYLHNKSRFDNIEYNMYQSEALHDPNKFTEDYKRYLDRAKNVFDYSLNNISRYSKAKHLPFRVENLPTKIDKRDNKILFYGLLTNRRLIAIEKLKSMGFQVDSVVGFFGDMLEEKAKDYKYVLSVGHMDNITNDSFRIIPALERGHIVIAEITEDWLTQYLMENFRNRIILFNYDTIVEDISANFIG